MMKMVMKSMFLAGLMAGAVLQAEATQITDPVSSDWTSPYGGMQWGTVGGLEPVEPGWQFSALSWGGGDKLTWKVFSGNTYAEETLQVTYYMGERTDGGGFPSSSYLHIGLFADVNADGSWSLDEMIAATTSSNPTPSDAWEQWVDTYTITASTTTTGGSNVLGKAIGFCVYADGGGVSKSMAFDSLRIETVEVPQRESTLITDEVSGGDYSGWTAFAGGFVWGASGGLDPVEGGWQFSTKNWDGNNKGCWKLFEEAFIEESLQVTYWMGERTDGDGFPSSDYLQVCLFADVNADGNWTSDEMIIPYSKLNPIPSDGWEQWVDKYLITTSTQTVGGSNVVGRTIGFCVYANGGGVNRSMAFDSLQIETTASVPDPAHLSMRREGSDIVITSIDLYPSSAVSNVLEKTTDLSGNNWTNVMPYSIGNVSNSWTVTVDEEECAFFRIRSLY